MKTYSVKQIADMLNTNPETVRRWIRDNKLKAVKVSRKDGNVVDEDELDRFLKETPKYARIATSMGAMMPAGLGIPVAIATLASGLMLNHYSNKNATTVRFRPDEIERYIKEKITAHEDSIKRKTKAIEQLEEEICEDQRKIDELKYVLKNSDFRVELDESK